MGQTYRKVRTQSQGSKIRRGHDSRLPRNINVILHGYHEKRYVSDGRWMFFQSVVFTLEINLQNIKCFITLSVGRDLKRSRQTL